MSEVIVKLTSDHIKVKGGEYVQDLVRCPDCSHFDGDEYCFLYSENRMKPDDFCSYGEKDDE